MSTGYKYWGVFLISLLFLYPPSVFASEKHGGETKLDRETLEFTKDWTKYRSPKITFMIKDQGRFIVALHSDYLILTKAFIKEVEGKKMNLLGLTEYADGVFLKVNSSLVQEAEKIKNPADYEKGVIALKPSDRKNSRLYICLRVPKVAGDYIPVGKIIEGMEILKNLKPGALIKDAFVAPYAPLKEHHH